MKVSARMKYIGAQSGESKEGKPYFVVGLLQDLQSEKVYVNKEIYDLTSKIPPFSDVDCILNIQIGQTRTFVNMDSIQLVKDKGKNDAK